MVRNVRGADAQHRCHFYGSGAARAGMVRDGESRPKLPNGASTAMAVGSSRLSSATRRTSLSTKASRDMGYSQTVAVLLSPTGLVRPDGVDTGQIAGQVKLLAVLLAELATRGQRKLTGAQQDDHIRPDLVLLNEPPSDRLDDLFRVDEPEP
ncbi:hypothetical protein OG905_00615 [Streptomyces sp. NBC_00322]|uniref:hypothetical protein n=1 Tax=Streptomyces sp. NBC_00322 TaxID=2975712 RepID=UPI002E2BECF1|nr:hypothetical protein [Streptomyces sp. NBC_00322]